MTTKCKQCRVEFKTYPSIIKAGRGKFHNKECYTKYHKTLVDKKSHGWKGGKTLIECKQCKKEFKIYPRLVRDIGNFHNNECRCKFQRTLTGKKNNAWKGGITPENIKIRRSIEFGLWREAVFARDNWTCQKYGIKGGKLHSHHIKNFAQYPELRFAIDNGTTLSEKAHREFHKKYNIKNNNKEQLEEFINQ